MSQQRDEPHVGQTITVKVETRVGPTSVVGVVESMGADGWEVRRRDGVVVTVDPAAVSALRIVPPGRAQSIPIRNLVGIAAGGWRALEAEPFGGWLLRASGGFTGRGNSVLVVDEPPVGVAAAVDRVEQWYAERGLPPRFQLSDSLAPAGLDAELAARGYQRSPEVDVMTSELAHVIRAGEAGGHVDDVALAAAPDAGWLASYRQDGGALPDVALDLLTNHPRVGFASIRVDGEVVAIARVTVEGKWAGVFAVEVAPGLRRRGLGRAVTAGAARWAGREGARLLYLQVQTDNSAALDLYRRIGFVTHHRYRYAVGGSAT